MMKSRQVLLIGLILIAAVLAACQPQQKVDSEFSALCRQNKHMWMRMEPLRNGEETGEPDCVGCMPEPNNHICNKDEYVQYLKKHGIIGEDKEIGMMGEEMHTMDTDMMHGMQHDDMLTAHAGKEKTAEVGDYVVNFNQPDAEIGIETSLAFTITEKSSDKQLTELDIMHEKPMHLVLVRDDLKYFDHVHPELNNYAWAVSYQFQAPGNYRLWADFTKGNVQHIVDFDLTVQGIVLGEEQSRLGDLQVDMDVPASLMIKEDQGFTFTATDAAGQPAPITETFLAADAHLIAIDESLQEFIHAHDDAFDNDNRLSFALSFDKAGKYKLWLQFAADGKNRVADFIVDVEDS